MRAMRASVIVLTALIAGATVAAAAYGDDLGAVFVGFALSVMGIILVSMTDGGR